MGGSEEKGGDHLGRGGRVSKCGDERKRPAGTLCALVFVCCHLCERMSLHFVCVYLCVCGGVYRGRPSR